MKTSKWIQAFLLVVGLVVWCQAGGTNTAQDLFSLGIIKPWTGYLRDGTAISEEDIDKILMDHQKWLNKEKGGKRANLAFAKLQQIQLTDVNLQGAILLDANLKESTLSRVNLIGSDLRGADLSRAHLVDTNLQGADIYKAILTEARISRTNFQVENLIDADLTHAIFEIKSKTLPDIVQIAKLPGLTLLRYENSPHALIELREAFKQFGLRMQEREITYALKHTGYLLAMKDGDLPTKLQVIAGKLVFDLPCQWGMSPMRPLGILLAGIGVFSPFYIFSLKRCN